jgi:hypothetical protein
LAKTHPPTPPFENTFFSEDENYFFLLFFSYFLSLNTTPPTLTKTCRDALKTKQRKQKLPSWVLRLE